MDKTFRGAIKMNSLHSPEHPGSVVRGRVRLAGRAACSCSASSGGCRSIQAQVHIMLYAHFSELYISFMRACSVEF